jgi:hypothetical protein
LFEQIVGRIAGRPVVVQVGLDALPIDERRVGTPGPTELHAERQSLERLGTATGMEDLGRDDRTETEEDAPYDESKYAGASGHDQRLIRGQSG